MLVIAWGVRKHAYDIGILWHPDTGGAYYGEHEAIIAIQTLEIMEGNLPKRALAMVLEWAVAHRQELMDDWLLAEQHQPLSKIEPLE